MKKFTVAPVKELLKHVSSGEITFSRFIELLNETQQKNIDKALAKSKSNASFEKELEELINKYSKENGSNTPDFVLAEYLQDALYAFNKAVNKRTTWYK